MSDIVSRDPEFVILILILVNKKVSNPKAQKKSGTAEGPAKKVSDNEGNRQQSMSSWWPPHHLMNKTFFDVGMWTPMLELWFQENLKAYRDGTKSVRTATQWRNVLRARKQCHRAITACRFYSGVHINSSSQ